MKISLVISDVDSTLITPEHEITNRAKNAVESLREKKIKFTIASSRPPRGLTAFAEQLQIIEPFAAFNGAIIQNVDGKVLMNHLLEREISEKAFEVSRKFNLGLWVYCEKDWFVSKVTNFVAREQETVGFDAIIENDLEKTFENVAKLVIVGNPEIVAEAETVISQELGDKVSATKSKPRFLDITSKDAHKGTVVTQLSEVLRIPTSEIAVIGDGLNDVLMFEKAGFSIAMGQAIDAVKKSANLITTSNTENGFATAIENFIIPAQF
ncbi:MAG: HAD family phosphatase [Pyrinomonadaceae bacterium]|nr:HAD family phosphatase [Pyrinomonadaceae bacterium]